MEEAEEQVAVEECRLCSEAGNVARREKCMGGCISNSEERYFQVRCELCVFLNFKFFHFNFG